MKKYIFSLLALLLPMAAWAAYTPTTVNLVIAGQNYAVQAQIDNTDKRIILGNGRNACIPQYIEGELNIPGTITVNGSEYTVYEIGQFAFRLCSNIYSVTIGEGVTRIGDCAFVGCSGIARITLPASLTSVGRGAFVGIKSMMTMECNGSTPPAWEYNDVFNYNGTAQSMRDESQTRVLHVPANSAAAYEQYKYNGTVGWKEAFLRIYEREASGSSVSNVVTINSMEEFLTFRDKVNDGTAQQYYKDVKSFELNTDLEFTSADWVPIGTADHPFDGSFDGGGHVIKGLKNTEIFDWDDINALTNSYTGLFGYANNAYIHNFHLQNPIIAGKDFSGSVLGYAAQNTHVSDVLVTCDAGNGKFTVAAQGSAGGIVGYIQSGCVDRCYFSGRVWSSKGWAGGIIGHLFYGKVEDCAAGANIVNYTDANPTVRMGGIVGGISNNGDLTEITIRRCLSWNEFIFNNGTVQEPSSNVKAGWIVGFSDRILNIFDCAYFNNNGNIKIANGYNVFPSFNAEETSRSGLMGNAYNYKLGDDNWHYFTEGYANYPIPITLKDMYLVNDIDDTDANGIVYLPVKDAEDNITAYKVKAYRGSSSTLTIPKIYKEKPVTHIMPHALEGDEVVTTLTMGSNVVEIGDSAFMGSAIVNLTLNVSDELDRIGVSAFEDCIALTAVDLPDKVTTVHARAFRGCDALTSFNIGKFFARHDDNFIANCHNLTSLTASRGNSNEFIAVDNVLFHNVNVVKSYVVACAPGKTGDYVIPVDLLYMSEINIFDQAFASCDKLTSITFPPKKYKTYTFGKNVFDGCGELRYIDLRGTGEWIVSRNDPDNPFYELPDRTIIWADANTSCTPGEENVIAGDWTEYLHLTDGWDFVPKVEFTASAVEMDRTLSADFDFNIVEEDDELTTEADFIPTGYTTYLPYPLTLTAENVSVYQPSVVTAERQTDATTGETVDVTVVNFVKVESGEMMAYHPYYIVVEYDDIELDNDNVVNITFDPKASTWQESGYTFAGTTVTVQKDALISQQAYILQDDKAWHRVMATRGVDDVYVGPFRAYFRAAENNDNPASKLVTRLQENGGVVTDVTVIRTIENNGDSRYFDINGRLLPGKPDSGIYIHNGNKYIAQ
ncbi:MAG: leucine-rich repeat protein [Muribaculaceae bacterium]|nr:leucine-rich repeat protein [Muribaculaceae bacterium]